MRRIICVCVTLVAAATFAGAQGLKNDRDDEAQGARHAGPRGCSMATLRGAYGIQMQGTRPSGPGGPMESVIGVVIRVYDGRGQFTQVDNVKGSISGIVPDREGFGTYEVNEDCTGVTHFQPGPGISIEEKLVIVKGGREVLSIVSNPLPVMMSTVQRKIGVR